MSEARVVFFRNRFQFLLDAPIEALSSWGVGGRGGCGAEGCCSQDDFTSGSNYQ